MSKPDEVEYAFPFQKGFNYWATGMTLRDYFAGQALIALHCNRGYGIEDMAAKAYQIADWMLIERNRPSEIENPDGQ